jgi:zinc protease
MSKTALPSRRLRLGLRPLLGLGILLLSLIWWGWPAQGAKPKHYTELQFPPLAEIQLPPYERYPMDNGLVVFLMQDHELPLVRGTFLFPSGSRLEPADQVGLADMTGSAMRLGGTDSHPPEPLNRLLEQQGAAIESGIETTAGIVSFRSLSPHLEGVLTLFAEVLREPAFAPEQVEVIRSQMEGQIARQNDQPGSIAAREFNQLIYGDDSPYARTPEYATLAGIDREDLIDFYQQSCQPQGAVLGIVGDFDPAQVKTWLQTTLGDWQGTSAWVDQPDARLTELEQAHWGGVYLVNQPQLTQSTVYLGHLDGQIDSPDYPALQVMNNVLNGFGGRLFREVRSRQGLAYTVFASWSPNYDYPGIFVAGGQTQSSTTLAFIESVQAEINRIREQPITEAELQYAKDSSLNGFVFNFENTRQILNRLLRYEYYGYPQDFIEQFRQQLEAVTIEDVQEVAQTYLQPDALVTLVVGAGAQIQPPLTELGPEVQELDVTIPPPV